MNNTIEIIVGPEGKKVTLNKIIDPLIEEVINGQYTLSFSSVIDADAWNLRNEPEVIVDGQHFDVVSLSKSRYGAPMFSVVCDHVSYRVSDDSRDLPSEEFEGTARSILDGMLSGTGFHVSRFDFDKEIYFRPEAKSLRGRIIELANFLNGELIWGTNDIQLVSQRGDSNGASFEYGVNIQSVREEIKIVKGVRERSLEIDVVDLAELDGHKDTPGFEKLKSVGLGDTVSVLDPELEIDTSLRVVRRQYNPFKKEIPQITIGRVIPDIIEYFRDEEERKDGKKGGLSVDFRGSGDFTVKSDEGEKERLHIQDFSIGFESVFAVKGSDLTRDFKNGNDKIKFPELEVPIDEQDIKIEIKPESIKQNDIRVTVGKEIFTNSSFNQSGVFVFKKPGDKRVIVEVSKGMEFFEVFGVDVKTVEVYGDSEYRNWLTSWSVAGESALVAPGLDKTTQAQAGEIKSPPIIEVSNQWGDMILKIPKDKLKDYFIRVYVKNLINGRSINTYDKNKFVDNEMIGAGVGPFEKKRETARYTVEFRSNGGYDLASIVKAFSFNATLVMPDDLDKWPGSDYEPDLSEDQYFIEFGSAPFATSMIYTFDSLDGYDSLQSVTHGVRGANGYPNPITVVFDEITKDGKVTGVKATSNWADLADLPELEISMQAVCKNNAKPPEVL